MLRPPHLFPLGLAACLASGAMAATANASPLGTPWACPAAAESEAFLAWGDPAEYFLAPEGTFASTADWTLSGGAAPVAGGDGFSLGGATPSTTSLALPDGSSATSPATCVSLQDPTLRFVAENTGSSSSTLAVSATVSTLLGDVTLPVGDLSASGSWSPTPVLPILDNLLAPLGGNAATVAFTFTPVGSGGGWRIDDLYVDPFSRGDG